MIVETLKSVFGLKDVSLMLYMYIYIYISLDESSRVTIPYAHVHANSHDLSKTIFLRHRSIIYFFNNR